ncbi:hypothetical protein ACFSUK_16365 [Sphingobium scionense]
MARQGEASHHCWLIVDGCVAVQTFGIDGQRQQLARHGPGSFWRLSRADDTPGGDRGAGRESPVARGGAIAGRVGGGRCADRCGHGVAAGAPARPGTGSNGDPLHL